jgi:agmatinase
LYSNLLNKIRMSFNPNDIGVANGNFCGLPVDESEAEIVIIPVPWDATASYSRGTAEGPEAILEASLQLDLYHHKYKKVYDRKIFMQPISARIQEHNERLGGLTSEYIDYLSDGNFLEDSPKFLNVLEEVATVQNEIRTNLRAAANDLLSEGKKVCLLGGEHSTPLGLLEAMGDNFESFGILQIDAHADLRDAYEGFEQSHASIMFNALKIPNLSHLVQVGIRDLCEDEVEIINTNDKVTTFYDWDLKENQFKGMNWHMQCEEIIEKLPKNVFISFDIDGLQPALCPNTGTPVPGGLSFEQATYLLQMLADSDKNIIGFDLNEVAPGADEINVIVGARMLMELLLCALHVTD